MTCGLIRNSRALFPLGHRVLSAVGFESSLSRALSICADRAKEPALTRPCAWETILTQFALKTCVTACPSDSSLLAPSLSLLSVMVFYHLLSLVLFAALCQAAILTDLTAVSKKTYDFIIVGGGTAGNLLGNRLSASGTYKVLIIEAGGKSVLPFSSSSLSFLIWASSPFSDLDTPAVEIPLLALSLAPNMPINFNYTTTAQSQLGGRTIPTPRGRLLGESVLAR